MNSLLKRFKRNERFIFFLESIGVSGGSPELRKGNSGWVPSHGVQSLETTLPKFSTFSNLGDGAK